MSGRKKTKRSKEDRISHLPDSLIHEILGHLSIKDVVRTSVLSKCWRNHWPLVPRLGLDSNTFRNSNAFASFAERVLCSNKESWISKLRLRICSYDDKFFVDSWIESAITRQIQYLDVEVSYYHIDARMPLSMYTSESLVHLRLSWVSLPIAEFVFFPCVKMMHLDNNRYPNEATLEKLISGSPILEDLVITSFPEYALDTKVVQVRSQSLKRVYIDMFVVVIDAPLLECFRTKIYSKKKFKFVDLGFYTKLDFHILCSSETESRSFIRDILTDISKVKDLVITNSIWKVLAFYHFGAIAFSSFLLVN